MSTYELTLESFDFPADLEGLRSSFRLLFDFRYYDREGGYSTTHAVLPGLDTYWECEKGHREKPNFVRTDDLSPRFDMGRIDVWDKLIWRRRMKESWVGAYERPENAPLLAAGQNQSSCEGFQRERSVPKVLRRGECPTREGETCSA